MGVDGRICMQTTVRGRRGHSVRRAGHSAPLTRLILTPLSGRELAGARAAPPGGARARWPLIGGAGASDAGAAASPARASRRLAQNSWSQTGRIVFGAGPRAAQQVDSRAPEHALESASCRARWVWTRRWHGAAQRIFAANYGRRANRRSTSAKGLCAGASSATGPQQSAPVRSWFTCFFVYL